MISPSGTSRAKIGRVGHRHPLQIRVTPRSGRAPPAPSAASCAASSDGSVNQRILPIPSKRKKTPMQIRRIARPVACRSIAMSPPLRPLQRPGRALQRADDDRRLLRRARVVARVDRFAHAGNRLHAVARCTGPARRSRGGTTADRASPAGSIRSRSAMISRRLIAARSCARAP